MKKLLLILFLSFGINCLANASEPELDFELSKFCYKQPDVQSRGKVYYFPNEEVGISAESICVYKDSYGQYFSQGYLKKGKKVGMWKKWFKNGQVSDINTRNTEGRMLRGQSFYKDGQKEWDVYYKNAIIREVKRWHMNGILSGEMSFDELSRGLISSWDKDGQIKETGSYDISEKPSIRYGLHTEWTINGYKASQGLYESDKKEGKWTYWHYENGKKKTEGFYKSGEKIGKWSKWSLDGVLLDKIDGLDSSMIIFEDNELTRALDDFAIQKLEEQETEVTK
jgi:antitoxin component YwqK of YwqJK toxin-antitoxin module